ncbi:hypothetical protein P171DRAFT_348134 [Karstenula rhodostoma CBS 690.94]|uniref:Uncharacterized protein n=1 Tax=Karstenula rhodostoma CBS 690.94 TaxID=1392251 RepID=A0A9P4PZP9_9PLEO|nr:hypothetical protein P171DRAFT_348134 [Karstenula rhodostoma CBS 690.94]
MSNDRLRKTSIPIHFHFAHSKRVVPALKDASRAVTSPLRVRKRPASILIPRDTPAHRKLPAAVQPEWTPVEISNYPPRMRQSDFIDLLQGYNISPEFDFPVTPRFTRPFRVTILAASGEEARRMVKDLDGKSVGEREIAVRMKGMTEKERKEFHIQDMADQIKTGIINTARVYHSDLADAILEVREIVQDGSCFAFLQKRAPVTIHSTPETRALGNQNLAKWEFVSGSACELEMEMEDSPTVPRLEALRGLQKTLENQGVLEKIWHKWSGSQVLMADDT